MDPLRAFHLRISERADVAPLERLLADVLPSLGVNVVVVECNDNLVFRSHPELGDAGLHGDDARRLAAAGRAGGIRVIPLLECFGHQGWAGGRNALLRAYPQFDETPAVPTDATWPDFYCPSWCPRHPDLDDVVFDLIAEVIEVFEADALHVGLDEVYAIADENCPRCAGADRAEIFGDVVEKLHHRVVGHHGIEMLMWADRLLDAESLGYSQWDGDIYGSWGALERVPLDVVLCDWHYDPLAVYPSVELLLGRGYTVWPSCWKDTDAALGLLAAARAAAEVTDAGARMPGMLVTGWDATARGLEQVLGGLESNDPGREEDRIASTLRTVLAALGAPPSPLGVPRPGGGDERPY